jgi:hypothetical protein
MQTSVTKRVKTEGERELKASKYGGTGREVDRRRRTLLLTFIMN